MYNNEIKDRFVELRAEGLSFDKIAAQLGTSKSTLHRWAEEREADIARLRRLQWEEMETEYGWRFEDQLAELNSSIADYEEHLRRIPVSQLNVRETVMLLRESRRQRDRLRALLMGTGTTSRKSNKTERFAENATIQPRNTNDLQHSNPKSFDSVTPDLRAKPRYETESNSRGLTSQETIDNPSVQPANAVEDQSQIENPKSEISSAPPLLASSEIQASKSNKTERIEESAATQPHNTNNLQQADSESFDFPEPPLPNPDPNSAPQSQIANPKSQIEELFLGSVVVNPYECAAAIVLKTLEQEAVQFAHNSP
jgi:hypothetical protein